MATMILYRYIATNFCKGGGVVLLLLLSLFSFLSLAEALEDVGKGSYGTADALSVVLLTTPRRLIDLLPVAALLGSVLGLGAMANQRELVALRASGMSTWRLAGVLAAIATLLSVVAIAILFFVIPPSERQAQEFRSRTLEQTALGGTEFWSRQGDQVIRVGSVDYGHIPRSVEIFELSDDGRLSRLITADRANIVDNEQWLLHSVEEKVIRDEVVYARRLERMHWTSFLTPDQVSTLIAPADALSALDLYRYLRESADSDVDTRQHQTLFWRQVALPLSLFAMIMLGLPLVINTVRVRSAGYRTVIGAAIGIGFYLFEQITAQLALLFELPPAATALAPAVLVLTLALTAIRRSA